VASCTSYFNINGTFVIKATTSDLELLSKFLAELQSIFDVSFVGRIYHSKDSKEYFAYVHILNSEIAEKLKDVSFLPNFPIEVDQH
jgi:hypothetical protein